MVITGFNAIAVNITNDEIEVLNEQTLMIFSDYSMEEVDHCLFIDLDEASSYLSEVGKPMLPVVTKTFNFPIGTMIDQVICDFDGLISEKIDGKILPSTYPVPKNANSDFLKKNSNIIFDPQVYQSNLIYPQELYKYRVTRGVNGIAVSIHFYPIRYNPITNTVFKVEKVNIDISYRIETQQPNNGESYDMVIIAPRLFRFALNPLVRHKNKMGVSTFLKTTEEIYKTFNGRDEQEQIKYFIKSAYENNSIKYVLLVGGMKGILNSWYLPVRMSNNVDTKWELQYITDLYYADLFNATGDFETWDSNVNGTFAEWSSRHKPPEDVIDGNPDVYVGRLACRSLSEVRVVVDKIIKYESKPHLPFWSDKFLAAGGDTFYYSNYPNLCEGEIITNLSASYLDDDYEIKRLWVSDGSLVSTYDVMRAIRQGTELAHFDGHGNPTVWTTHPKLSSWEDEEEWIIGDGLSVFQMPRLFNLRKLPILLVNGCHNSQFNVTPLKMIEGIINEGADYFSEYGHFWYADWVRECFAWKLISVKYGGAIATIGNTGLGLEVFIREGVNVTDGLSGYIAPRVFHAIGVLEKTTVGEAHTQSIIDYVTNFDINDRGGNPDRKTAEQWVLLGDPSLKIGGYR